MLVIEGSCVVPRNMKRGVVRSLEPEDLDRWIPSWSTRNIGRRVERQAQEMPTHGSTSDQIRVSTSISRKPQLAYWSDWYSTVRSIALKGVERTCKIWYILDLRYIGDPNSAGHAGAVVHLVRGPNCEC